MKHVEEGANHGTANVAPRAGAWIETIVLIRVALRQWVAPRAGAWIETAETMPYALRA